MPTDPRLARVEWDDLLPRLLLFATRHRRRFGLHRRADSPSAEDLVQEAITAAFEGRRTWPSHIDAFGFLSGAIRSLTSNAVVRAPMASIDEVRSASTVPPDRAQLASLREFIRQCLAEDEQLRRLAELLFDDARSKAAFLAEEMGVPVGQMYQMLRKLRRRLNRCLTPDGTERPL